MIAVLLMKIAFLGAVVPFGKPYKLHFKNFLGGGGTPSLLMTPPATNNKYPAT